jgi:antirestriction protein ArdC
MSFHMGMLDRRVRMLIEATHVMCIGMEDFITYTGNEWARRVRGVYEMNLDVIGLQPSTFTQMWIMPGDSINITALHELMHWTGNNRRLNRRAHAARNRPPEATEWDSLVREEEAIAELAAIKLAGMMGLATNPELSTILDHYLSSWWTIITPEVEFEANRAVDYILEITGVKAEDLAA